MVKEKLQIGDIFSLKLDNGEYAFGRCISKISFGHVVEIFDCFSDKNEFSISITEKRLFEPIPIDTWGLFGRRKKEGEWQVIEHQDNYTPVNVDYLCFWGMGGDKSTDTKLLGVFDNDCGNIPISKVNDINNRIQGVGLHFRIKDKGWENKVFLSRSPWGDTNVKKEIEKYVVIK
jgi:hypothetical protein